MSAVSPLPQDRPLHELGAELDIAPERLRYWIRVGLLRVYRIDRIYWVRRVDEPWVRQLALLISLGVSVDALADAARRLRLPRMLEELADAADTVDVPSWLR